MAPQTATPTVGAPASNPLLDLPTMLTDLARVDDELRKAVESDDAMLTEIAGHLIKAGGKRIRPGFTIAAAAVTSGSPGPASHEVVLGGVSVELVHLGSLYHDDVMDEAETRRTVESVNHRWGNLKAILGGDFLLAKASEIAASLGTEVAGLLAATIGRLCEGQIRELRSTFDPGRTEAAYLASVSGKTAALLAAAGRIGGIVAGHPRTTIDRLTTFGHEYGVAFQIVDDVLDIVATDEQLGKPAGNDLVQGVYTLPTIRALAGPEGDGLRRLLGRDLDPAAVLEARRAIVRSGAVTSAIATARSYLDGALEAIAPLEGTPGYVALRGAADYLVASIPTVPTALGD